jgi:hypothetical protein
MLTRLATQILKPGFDTHEIGLMAATSPEIAAAMGLKLAEWLRESASVGESALVAIPANADRGVDQCRPGDQA